MRNSQSNQRVAVTVLILAMLNSWLILPGWVGEKPLGGPPNVASVPASELGKPDSATRAKVTESYGKLPLSFEANEGQFDRRVQFVSRAGSQALFLTATEAVLTLAGSGGGSRPERPVLSSVSDSQRTGTVEAQGAALRMKLVGANPDARVTGLDELRGKSNYFIGKDPKKWRTNVSNYAKVKYEHVYPGVDLVYYGNPSQLEYDLIVAPGADPNRIKLAFEGHHKMRIDEAGDLVLSTTAGDIRHRSPLAYQELDGRRERVRATYAQQGENEIAFELGRYDASRPLVIDPVLVYSTYLGGSSGDGGNSIAVDSAGDAYITGFTNSNDFPTLNPLQPANASFCCLSDVFVTKLNAAGSALVYSTYIGGGASDQGNAIAVDPTGNTYITGTTNSTDFPIANALQASHIGVLSDAFVVKLGPTGGAFIYSTYLGGSLSDSGAGVAADASGNAYITGSTGSTDFPTANPLQPNQVGAFSDCFLTKINSSGTSFVYSTYLGGVGSDAGRGIAVDTSGNAYVAGVATSPDFPLVNPLQSEFKDRTVFKSIDGSGSWTTINNGVPVQLIVNTIAVDPSASSTVYVGTNIGAFKSIDGGTSWSAINSGLFSLSISQLQIHPKAPSILYGANGSIVKSTDAGMSWNSILNMGDLRIVAVDPRSLSNVYAARGQQIFKSTDGGSTWRTITVGDFFSGQIAGSLQSVAVDPTTPSTVYAGDFGGVFKSTNGGNTWRGRLGIFAARGIAVDPVNGATVYGWGLGSGIAKSTDGGQTSTLINSGLATTFVRCVAIDPTTTTTLYAGTDSGVFKSTDGGGSWSTTSNRLTNASVGALAVDPTNTSTIFAGTDPGTECFVAKLNSQGTALLYSTYLGGDTSDAAAGIAVDGIGNAYVAGATSSRSFPARNPVQSFGGGRVDGFVAKLNTVGSELVYSTHFGGASTDNCLGIAVDAAGNAYVTGQTLSIDFPTLVPLQASLADGGGDAFLAKLNATGSALVFSTYWGGGEGAPNSNGGFDLANAIAIDHEGNAYITGVTASDSYPTTPGAFQRAKRGPSGTAFVAKISDPPPFDVCLQDDSSGALLLVNTNTGDYQFIRCSGGITLSGSAAIIRRGCLITLQVNGPDRRLLARIDTCMKTGNASIQLLSQGVTFTIIDRSTANNSCDCSGH